MIARAGRAAWLTHKNRYEVEIRLGETIGVLVAANRLAALPASPLAPATPTATDQPKQQKKHHRAYKGVDDQCDDPAAKMNADSAAPANRR